MMGSEFRRQCNEDRTANETLGGLSWCVWSSWFDWVGWLYIWGMGGQCSVYLLKQWGFTPHPPIVPQIYSQCFYRYTVETMAIISLTQYSVYLWEHEGWGGKGGGGWCSLCLLLTLDTCKHLGPLTSKQGFQMTFNTRDQSSNFGFYADYEITDDAETGLPPCDTNQTMANCSVAVPGKIRAYSIILTLSYLSYLIKD